MAWIKMRTEPRDRLRVYLNDHLAGAVAGIRLADRCRKNNSPGPLAAELDGLVGDLEEDRSQLRSLMRALDIPAARPKQLAAIAGERLARLKLNGQLTGYSPLSRLVELEALCSAVDTKRNLWVSLREVPVVGELGGGLDLDTLIGRAEAQRRSLEEHRRVAAVDAFAEQMAEES